MSEITVDSEKVIRGARAWVNKIMASPPHKKDSGDNADEALEDAPELFQENYNNSIVSTDTEYEYLVLYFYNNSKYIARIEEEKKRKLFQNFYNNLRRPWFMELMDYLIEHKAIMWETLSKNSPWFKQQDFYRSLRIIKPFIKKVKISNPNIITQGNLPKIYMLKWASPKDFHNEQTRYAKILLEEKEAEREFIQLQQQRAIAKVEAQSEARALKVQNFTDQVFDALSRPHDRHKITPIYETMNIVGVDTALREGVKNGIIDRINKEAEAEWH